MLSAIAVGQQASNGSGRAISAGAEVGADEAEESAALVVLPSATQEDGSHSMFTIANVTDSPLWITPSSELPLIVTAASSDLFGGAPELTTTGDAAP